MKMNNKQGDFLLRFAYCAIIVLIFAGFGGCARSCAKKANEASEKRQREKDRRWEEEMRRRKRNKVYVFNTNDLDYGCKFQKES